MHPLGVLNAKRREYDTSTELGALQQRALDLRADVVAIYNEKYKTTFTYFVVGYDEIQINGSPSTGFGYSVNVVPYRINGLLSLNDLPAFKGTTAFNGVTSFFGIVDTSMIYSEQLLGYNKYLHAVDQSILNFGLIRSYLVKNEKSIIADYKYGSYIGDAAVFNALADPNERARYLTILDTSVKGEKYRVYYLLTTGKLKLSSRTFTEHLTKADLHLVTTAGTRGEFFYLTDVYEYELNLNKTRNTLRWNITILSKQKLYSTTVGGRSNYGTQIHNELEKRRVGETFESVLFRITDLVREDAVIRSTFNSDTHRTVERDWLLGEGGLGHVSTHHLDTYLINSEGLSFGTHRKKVRFGVYVRGSLVGVTSRDQFIRDNTSLEGINFFNP